MNSRRILGFIRRLLRGEDVILVLQDKAAWERQFRKKTWDRLTSGQPNTDAIAKRIKELCARHEIVRVLDVGCGNGGLAHALGEFPTNLAYLGTDLSETAIAAARATNLNAAFEATPAEDVPKVRNFDCIVFNEVFLYIDARRILPLYRSAFPDALIIISIERSWRSWFLWRRIGKYVHIMRTETLEHTRRRTLRRDVATGRFIL
jgi:2-polyprenyl-3-methyl-5-hydroxy-6-metoxy-1,4-benzoquinol methylase